MKRIIFLIFAVAAAFLAGCSHDLTVDMDKAVALDTNAPPVNLAAEIARAKSEHKLLLMEFGSSDSCPPCVAFQKYVASTPQFAAYEKSNLVFVRLDYPLKSELHPDAKATNILLSQQFDVVPFPTFIALDANGKEFWRQEGLKLEQLSTPAGFITLIETVKAQEK